MVKPFLGTLWHVACVNSCERNLIVDLPQLATYRWRVSLFNTSCLVATVECLWGAFNAQLSPGFSTPEDQEFFRTKFKALAYSVRKMDSKGRWHLTPEFFADGNGEFDAAILIVPNNQGWLEIWDEGVWRMLKRYVPKVA